MEIIYRSLVHTGSWGYLFHEIPSIRISEIRIINSSLNKTGFSRCTYIIYTYFFGIILCTLRIHVIKKNILSIYLSLFYLFNHLSIYLSINLSICLFIYLSICLFIYLSFYLCIYLSIYLSVYFSIYSPIYLSVYLFLHLSLYQSIYIYIHISIYSFV